MCQLHRRWAEHQKSDSTAKALPPFRVATDQVSSKPHRRRQVESLASHLGACVQISNPTYNEDLVIATEQLIRLQVRLSLLQKALSP